MDYNKIEKFWKSIDNHNLFSTMLSDDKDFVLYRHNSEKEKIFSNLNLNKDSAALDLGCGPGRWSIVLSSICKKVVAVDYIKKPDFWVLDNIEYHQQNVLDFETDKKFDVIFLSGVIQYINDVDIEKLITKCHKWLKDDGRLVIISTVSLKNPFGRMDGNFEGCYRTLKQHFEMLDIFDNVDYMDSHGMYLFGLNKYKLFDYILSSQLLQSVRYWYVRNFREYPGMPKIFICWK